MEKYRERMLELLADQALFGLTEGETAELKNLKNRFSEFKDDDSFEMTAATINLINLGIEDSLPAHLQTKLEAQAQEFFASAQKNQVAVLDESADIIHEVPSKSSIWNWRWLTLAGAAAACIALAIGLWLNGSEPQPEIAKTQKQIPEATRIPETEKSPEIATMPEPVKTPEPLKSPEVAGTQEPVKTPKITVITPEIVRDPTPVKITPTPVKTPPPELTAAQKREQLLASAPDVIQTIWTSAKNDKRAMGDVVWSNSQQKGYVRLRDLPALDPTKETYQLWIVDEAQNKKTPVSGGVFNVSQAGEIIIPITAQLRIQKPKQFALTKEKAGGVVVSKPDRIVAVAKV
jgi:anti-sigma-K factor RskA